MTMVVFRTTILCRSSKHVISGFQLLESVKRCPRRRAISTAVATSSSRRNSSCHDPDRVIFVGTVQRQQLRRQQHRGVTMPKAKPGDRKALRWESSSSSGSNHYFSRPSTIQDESLSFKVAKVNYKTGRVETIDMMTSELLRSTSIKSRDLITLNLTSRCEQNSNVPARRPVADIMPRPGVIVLSFGNIRAVVGTQDVFLLEAHNPAVQHFAHELAVIFGSGNGEGEPHELVLLEHILRDTVDCFNRRLRLFEPIVDSFLDKVASEVYSDTGVHQLVPLKDSLQSFEIQVRQNYECLKDILNDDEAMLDLLLSEQAVADETGKEVEFSRHEHVELLLGVYARQLSNCLLEIKYLLGRLQSKQEFVALALAAYRNRMVRMNLHIGIATLSLGFGTTMAGFFGMNLVTGLEHVPGVFGGVVLASGLGGAMIAAASLNHLSGHTMKKRAAQRLEEIETLTGALREMAALDYTVKYSVEQGIQLDKKTFRRKLEKFRQSKTATDQEVDLLFDILDPVKDGTINRAELALLESKSRRNGGNGGGSGNGAT